MVAAYLTRLYPDHPRHGGSPCAHAALAAFRVRGTNLRHLNGTNIEVTARKPLVNTCAARNDRCRCGPARGHQTELRHPDRHVDHRSDLPADVARSL